MPRVNLPNAPKRFGMVLYPGFQLTDVSGPLDVINSLSSHVEGISLAILAATKAPVSTSPKCWPENTGMPPFTTAESITPTHTFADAPLLDVLIIPGGMGCFDPNSTPAGQPDMDMMRPIIDFTLTRYPTLQYFMTVCTGSGIGALTGLFDGKRATTFKGGWGIIPKWRPQVNWVPKARWVVDGNIWTSSGVTSGTDMLFAFVKEIYEERIAKEIAVWMEYCPHEDPADDPFAVEQQ
jgi:transcriptional regulator GlxA family with amidase domain